MARIRTIKPEFWTDEKVVQLPFEARLLFIGLWNFVDDDGYMPDEPDRIRLQILPNDALDAEMVIDLLVTVDLVQRVDIPDGRTLLHLPNFSRHQKISHRTATKFPVATGKKRAVPAAARRQVALKYGCKPGQMQDASCYYCGSPGIMKWWPLSNGRPSAWVSFSGLEIDHFVPENSGGASDENNLVLACRYCNRSKHTADGLAFVSRKIRSAPEVSGLENSGALRPEGKGIEGNRSTPPLSLAAPRVEPLPEGGGGGDANAPKPPKVEATSADAVAVIQAFDTARTEAYGPERARPWPTPSDAVTAKRWLEAGATLDTCRGVFQAMNARWKSEGRDPPASLKAFDAWIAGAIRDGQAPMPEPARASSRPPQRQGNVAEYDPGQTEQRWRDRVDRFCRGKMWLEDQWGPVPTAKGTHVPAGVLAEFADRLPAQGAQP